MLRVINFFCVAFMGLAILALYHVSESTRVARVELSHVDRQINDTRSEISVLETEWERVAGPARVQELAQRQGMSDSTSVRLSSFEQLPNRGETRAPASPVRNASAVVPQQPVSSTDSGM